jgi:hypothetical protein
MTSRRPGVGGAALAGWLPYARTMTAYASAVQNPSDATVARRARSVRRTSHVDMLLSDEGTLDLVGGARDLLTMEGGAPQILGVASVAAVVGQSRLLEKLAVQPAADTASLLGLPVAAGFRAAVDRAVPEHRDRHSPLYLLLDDLPVAALISGYATLYRRGSNPPAAAGASIGRRRPMADICAGWRSDGVMMTTMASGRGSLTPVGPLAPTLERSDDPMAWHEIEALAPGAMRRRRLVDVAAVDSGLDVLAMFRDTHVDEAGDETVLHEYELHVDVEPETMTVRSCVATARALPWPECPAAAASARRLEGHRIDDIRTLVRTDFRGTSTCTHLNDLLRSLGDVAALAWALD